MSHSAFNLGRPLGVLLAAGAALTLAGCETMDGHGVRPVTATLTGAAEVPGPGDPDGAGAFRMHVDPMRGDRVCHTLSVSGIAPATAAHIHRGEAGTFGPPVITLEAPTDGASEACVTADVPLVAEIMLNPGRFYVNVHNASYPTGAIRGQLTR